MNQWFWLLLPLAAMAGWLVATTKSANQQREGLRSDIPLEYLQGLGFLIDQQHDKATEIFIKLFEADSDTVDTHFVLGNLFRQKGEIEKAIRIHQNIIARPNLNDYYRTVALFELGRDYFSLGILDRAEKFFNHALAMKVEHIKFEAYSCLASLYEVEENWEEAIKVAQKLSKHNGGGYGERVSHYYCELVEQAMRQGDYVVADKLLAKVRAGSIAWLRATLLKGDLAFERGDSVTAEKYYSAAFTKHPKYAKLLLPRIRRVFASSSASRLADYLRQFKSQAPSASYLLAYFQSLLDSRRVDEAEEFFSELIKQRCMPLAVVKLYLEYKLDSGSCDDTLIGNLIKSLEVSEGADFLYQCSGCGLKTQQLYWRCPSCSCWGTSQPRDFINSSPEEAQQRQAQQAETGI